MNKKIAIVLVTLFVTASILIYNYFNNNNHFMYAGTLETTKVILSSKVGTDVLYFPYEEGASVKKGEIVAKLNDDAFQIASKQLDADYKRYKELNKKGSIAQADVDKTKRLKEENDLKIKWCEIKSPIDGTIITKFREEGEYANIGSNIVSIADPYNIWAYFYVPYDAVNKLKTGQKVKGFLQELPNKSFEGVILKINEEAEFTPKNVQTREERTRLIYGIKVRFDNKDLILKAGMTMETYFE